MIHNTKMESLKRKESAMNRDRILDTSNKVQARRVKKHEGNDANEFDLRMNDTNVKFQKRNLMKGKIHIRKAKEDLELVTSYFERNPI